MVLPFDRLSVNEGCARVSGGASATMAAGSTTITEVGITARRT